MIILIIWIFRDIFIWIFRINKPLKFCGCWLRLIETEKFVGYWDRGSSSRLRNLLDVKNDTHINKSLLDVETKTSRLWAIDVDTETPSRLLLITPWKWSNFVCIQNLRKWLGFWVQKLRKYCSLWKWFRIQKLWNCEIS